MLYITGVDCSEEEDEEGEEGEVRQEGVNQEGVAVLTDTLQSVSLHWPVCKPNLPSKV